jgi:hypothetical protein
LRIRNPWEGVNLLPFIDIKLLKDTVAEHCPASKLSKDEAQRNMLGTVVCYRYDLSCTETVASPMPQIGLSDIVGANSSTTVIRKQASTGVPFKPELVQGTVLPYPGFPTLNVLPIASVELTQVGLNCFGTPSKYPNTILSLYRMPDMPPLEVIADNVLDRSVFVNWPMMHEGRVTAITSKTQEIRMVNGQKKIRKFNSVETDRWLADSEQMAQTYYIGNGVVGSGGLVTGEILFRLKVLPLQGMKNNPTNGAKTKIFGRQEADVPLQLILLQAPAPDPRFIERGPMTLQERFPEKSPVVLTKGKYRGCKGTVVGIADTKNLAVKVQTYPAEMPFGLAIARTVQESYVSSYDAARILKMTPGLFGKFTGRLQFVQGKYDLGLNLKSNDGTCVVGYTRKKVVDNEQGSKDNKWTAGDSLLVIGSTLLEDDDGDERILWEYSPKAIRLIEAYRQKFPQLFSGTKQYPDEKRYDANKIFGPNGEAWLPIVREWLDTHETAKLPRSPVTTESMSYDAVAAVQKAADVRSLALKKRGFPQESLIKIPGSALYREGSTGATDVLSASDLNNSDAPQLGDRVVNLCADGIPFGTRGTVVGVHQATTTGSVEVVMDEEFIGGNTLQGACSNFRGKLCLWAHLLKIQPDNSSGLVDKLVPKGSGKAAVNKIMASISAAHADADTKNNVDAAVVPATPARPKAVEEKSNVISVSSPRRAESSGRAESALRGKQGVWKEAIGPDKKGIGFKGKLSRKGESGFARWQDHVRKTSSQVPDIEQVAMSIKKKSTETAEGQLKAILGVKPTQRAVASSSVASDNLKQILGVNVHVAEQATVTATALPSGATADLKMMLGMKPTNEVGAPPAQNSAATSAANKLLQLMASKQSTAPQQYSGRFNFTYVEEGKEAPTSRMPLTASPQNAHLPPVGYPGVPIPMPGYGLPPGHGGFPMPLDPQGLPPHVHQFNVHPQGKPYSSHGANLPAEDFPLLGASPKKRAQQQESKTSESPRSPVAFNMVPSVVSAKAKH